MVTGDFVSELAERIGPHIETDSEGRVFAVTQNSIRQIGPDLPPPIRLGSLGALNEYLKCGEVEATDAVITIDDHRTVTVLGKGERRREWARAEGQEILETEEFIAPTKAVIWLRRAFRPDEQLDEVLSIVSSLTAENKVTFTDDGLASTVVSQTGQATQSKMKIRPAYALAPRGGFGECVLPPRNYNLRVDRELKVALIPQIQPEWDGACTEQIATWIRANAPEGWKVLA